VGKGDIPGLGAVTERYTLLVETANPNCADWRTTALFTITAKDTIRFALKSPGCVNPNSPNGSMNYTVTTGTGRYARASGSGTLTSIGHESSPGKGTGTDTGPEACPRSSDP
jgi:hypothetical protein